jgi:hypothetical protein
MRLLIVPAVIALAACGGEVTGGGTGSDTDFDEIEDRSAVLANPDHDDPEVLQGPAPATPTQGTIGQPLQEGVGAIDGDVLRAEDYPAPGEEMTRNPIQPGNEEPGGKDLMLEEEYEAMDEVPPPNAPEGVPD